MNPRIRNWPLDAGISLLAASFALALLLWPAGWLLPDAAEHVGRGLLVAYWGSCIGAILSIAGLLLALLAKR